jgi:hypothetical protein
MADAEDPFALVIELPDDADQARIVPQVFRGAPADQDHRLVLFDDHIVEGHVGLHPVPGSLAVGVPSRLEVVHHEVHALLRRRRDACGVAGFLKPVDGEPGLVTLAAISGHDEDVF